MSFQFALNTSTIRTTPLLEQIRVAAAAGYDGIELWVADVEAHLASGGQLAEVAHALDDADLRRPSMISLRGWCLADEDAWLAASGEIRRRLEIAAGLGVARIVAGPPREEISPLLAAERYRQLLDLSVEYGVPASLEFLGFVPAFATLETAWLVCQLADHPAASITLDAWHLFRGGSESEVVAELPPERISIVHWDDAPAEVPREEQTDADRVMPGDGILDLAGLGRQLQAMGWSGFLSLELFHAGYWKQDPWEVARQGLEKMRRSLSELAQ
jgi:sugar phosphate isomerase/epimerase